MATLKGSWSRSFASSSWSKSWSTSPLRSGTLAMVRTPGPGGIRTQRSGAITPRRAAWARSKREVCVGKRSVTCRAISAPVAVIPTNTGPIHGRLLVAAEQRAADPLAVAAVAQLAEELVDEVAAVGEDQHTARARGLHEA